MHADAVSRFLQDQEGVTLIEYALLAGLLSIVAVALLPLIGTSILTLYQRVSTQLAAVAALP